MLTCYMQKANSEAVFYNFTTNSNPELMHLHFCSFSPWIVTLVELKMQQAQQGQKKTIQSSVL